VIKQVANRISKIFYWEFWPVWLSGSPLVLFLFYFGIKARKLFFLTNVNPAFENSALLYASKFKILQQLNPSAVPKSVFFKHQKTSLEELSALLESHQLQFPIIVKPDKGERGLLVEKICNLTQLHKYLSSNKIDFIIQEFVNLPNEIGIFFNKMPGSENINISSVCLKEFLNLKGDGISTIRELLENDFHGKHQIDRFEECLNGELNEVLKFDQIKLLEPIGNHSRGTKFMDGSHLIDQKVIDLVKFILQDKEGINYGRFDIKYNTISDLKDLKNFKVIELNGVASEPTHVYDRSINIIKKYKIWFDHWNTMYQISQLQSLKGYSPLSARTVLKILKNYFGYLRNINRSWNAA
jgi:hypothetical protein